MSICKKNSNYNFGIRIRGSSAHNDIYIHFISGQVTEIIVIILEFCALQGRLVHLCIIIITSSSSHTKIINNRKITIDRDRLYEY